jgi:hypothetical protein
MWPFNKDHSKDIEINNLKLRIEQLEKDLDNERVYANAFSQNTKFLEDQNKQLARRFNAYKNCAKSLCVEVQKYGYGSIAVQKFRSRTDKL